MVLQSPNMEQPSDIPPECSPEMIKATVPEAIGGAVLPGCLRAAEPLPHRLRDLPSGMVTCQAAGYCIGELYILGE